MGRFLILQNRELPPQMGGGRVVYAWPGDEPEAFCASDDQAFTDSAHSIIVAGTARCALHGLFEQPCLVAYRQPPECRHERLDPSADPAHPRCVTCGLVGEDGTSQWLRMVGVPDDPGAPSEVEVVAVGEPLSPEAS